MNGLAELAWAVVLAGGGGAAVAFGAIKLFGERWLENRFASRLQDLRHEHERKLEASRLRGSQSLDRSTKLSEREFEKTAEAWSLVTDANFKTLRALPGLRTFEDLSRLSDDLTELVAKQAKFADWEIKELLKKPKNERLMYFSERNTIHEIGEAKIAIGKASGQLTRNALFIDKEVYTTLSEFLDWAFKAMIDWEIVREIRRGPRVPDALKDIRREDEEFRKGAEEKIAEIESLIRTRFWPTKGKAG